MAAQILDGKTLAARIKTDVAAGVARLKAESEVVPGLTVVLVGDDPASQVYVRNKQASCKAAGMNGHVLRLPADTTQATLLETIDRLNDDPTVHGILVQLPAAAADRRAHHRRACRSPEGRRWLSPGERWPPGDGGAPVRACTPLGIRALLLDAKIETRGAHAVVLGRSQIVGKPMALLLLRKGPGGDATVTVCHTATRDAAAMARQADILIAAVGRPEQVRADWIKPGATVIDVGIHKRPDGSLCGDVHFASVLQVAGAITPVPGGVGPLTVAMLLKNTLQAASAGLALPESLC